MTFLTLRWSSNKSLTVFAEQDKSVHCTDECRALGHSDRCWMPKLRVGSQADSADNRTNLFIPVGMDAMVETEIYGTISRSSRKTLSTFGKEQRESTILVANVKPYLKSQRALSPPLQESPSVSSSPTKNSSTPLDLAKEESKEEREGGSDSSAYGPPDGQCSPPHTELEEPPYLTRDLRPKSLSSSLIHSSVISQECGGSDCALEPRDPGNWQVRWPRARAHLPAARWWYHRLMTKRWFILTRRGPRHALYNQKPSALYVFWVCGLLCLGEICVLDCHYGMGEKSHRLPGFKCFHGVLYLSV